MVLTGFPILQTGLCFSVWCSMVLLLHHFYCNSQVTGNLQKIVSLVYPIAQLKALIQIFVIKLVCLHITCCYSGLNGVEGSAGCLFQLVYHPCIFFCMICPFLCSCCRKMSFDHLTPENYVNARCDLMRSELSTCDQIAYTGCEWGWFQLTLLCLSLQRLPVAANPSMVQIFKPVWKKVDDVVAVFG